MSTPLRTLVTDLLHDASARAAFAADPGGYLGDHGWDDLDGADVGTALVALRQELPIEDATRLGDVDTDSFGDGPAGAVAGLQAAAGAFDEAWEHDPATTLDGAADDDPSNGIDDDGGRHDPPGELGERAIDDVKTVAADDPMIDTADDAGPSDDLGGTGPDVTAGDIVGDDPLVAFDGDGEHWTPDEPDEPDGDDWAAGLDGGLDDG